MMPPFTRTLQFRLSVILLLFGAALLVSNHVMQLRRELDVRRKSLELQAYSDGTRLSGVAQHLLGRKLYHAVDLEMSYASATPELVQGVICDQNDIVRHATRRQWNGLGLKDTPLRIVMPMLAQARSSMQGQMREVDRGRRFVAVFPYLTGRLFNETGVVVMEYDLARATAEARAHALNLTISRGFLLLAGCLLLWLVLQYIVTSRVQAIISHARAVGTNAPLPAPLGGRDEFSLISRSIIEAGSHLRDTQIQLAQMMENLRDVFWVAPLRGGMEVRVNDAYDTLWHRSRQRLATHRWDWLIPVPREQRRSLLKLLQELQQGRASAEIELRLVTAGLPVRWLQARAFLVRDHQGVPHALAGFAFDVTERKNVEKRLLLAAEEERRRIGSDLHDDVCQRLAAAKLKSGMLKAGLAGAHLPQAALAGELAVELALANNVVRGFAKGLMPVAMGVDDLAPAFNELGKFIERSFHVACQVDCQAGMSGMDPEAATHLYRISQELAVNAAKHAGASTVSISLTCDERLLILEVSNDGAAFVPDKPGNGGMGLHLVRRRVEAMGASLVFKEHPGGGTRVICEVPVASIAIGAENPS